jgi:CcmD family protein
MRVVLCIVVLFAALGRPAPASADALQGPDAAAQQPAAQPQPEPPKPTDEFVPISQLPPQDQLPAAPLLIAAYAFVWVAVLGYLVSVGRRLSTVQREVDRLESDISKGTHT